jgi:hypothetical protein
MFVFPLAIALSLFSTTAFLIVLAILGNAELSAEVGIVQGASLGIFLAFSANGRNLILRAPNTSRFVELVRVRLLLVPVLCLGVWLLGTWVVPVEQWLIGGLVLRRSLEWLGELSLSEAERSRDLQAGRRFTAGQAIAFALLAAAAIAGGPWLKPAFLLWSLSPLVGGAAWILPALRSDVWRSPPDRGLRTVQLAAHLTSSWAIGISTYLFRLLLVLLVGKALAGSLVAGFALGGMLNSLYTYAVGPSLISGSLSIKRPPNGRLRAIVFVLAAVGLIIAVFPGFPLKVQPADGTNWPVFIQTIGFSIVGGLVMIWAQSIRLELLHATDGDHVMVPDVLANILILATVPFVYYLLGPSALPLLFLWNAVLTAVIYRFARLEEVTMPATRWAGIGRDRLQAWLTLLLCLPLFFQLSGEVFRSKDFIFDSHGRLLEVPLPLSAIFCFLGLGVLLKAHRARMAVAFLFAFFVGMLPNVLVVAASNSSQQLSKMILLIQFILPVFALALGQSYVMPARTKYRYDVVLFTVALAVMTAEVLASWLQGSKILVPYLFLFSIYQHLQYVPTLLLVLIGVALPTMLRDNRWRPWVVASAPVYAVYATAAVSMLALGIAIACLCGGAWYLWVNKKRQFAVLWAALFAVSLFGYFQIVKTTPIAQLKLAQRATWSQQETPALPTEKSALPSNIAERLGYWRQYWDGITESPKIALLGHIQRPDRETTPSAHNYYLDLVYNFGAVALLPWLFIFYRTAKLAWSANRGRMVTTDVWWLLGAVAFFALVDNSLKVGFRQPYPGILMFFLWGVLLARLSAMEAPPRG